MNANWSDLLPHGEAALLLTDVVSVGSDRICCAGAVGFASAYAEDGKVSSIVVLEMAAQAAALLEGDQAGTRAGGLLVTVRRVELLMPHFDCGQDVLLRVERAANKPPLYAYHGQADVSDTAVAIFEFSIVINQRSSGEARSH